MVRRRKAPGLYDPAQIVDAPEHHAFSRALGILTWGTWDHEVRPVEERRRDFIEAFAPEDPTAHLEAGVVAREDGSYGPAPRVRTVERFNATDSRTGSLPELLARYGLKLRDGPAYVQRPLPPSGSFVEIARRRNQKLRTLYGSVDVEAKDMDAAKADFLEKRRAAQEIREARQRMKAELDREEGKKDSSTEPTNEE